MNINEKLKNLRAKRNLTQREVADGADIERVSYNRYENGTRVPTIDAVVKLASFFDCTTDYLLGRTDEPTFVEFKTETPEGDKIVIELDREYYKGLTKEKIERLIEMGMAWQEASDNIKKKPSKD